MDNIIIEQKNKGRVNYKAFILTQGLFNKIEAILTRNMQFYKYDITKNGMVEIDIGTMINVINAVLLKINVSCDLEYLEEIGGKFFCKYKEYIDKFLEIYPDCDIENSNLKDNNYFKRRNCSIKILEDCVNRNNTSKLVDFINITYLLNDSISNIYKYRDLTLVEESVMDSLKYILNQDNLENYKEKFKYYLDNLDMNLTIKYVKDLQKIILEDWHQHITNPNKYIAGEPFKFLCHSTNSTDFEGDFYSRFVSTSLLTETFTTTYHSGFGFIMDDANIVMASGHDMFVNNTAKNIDDILPTTIPTIDSFGKVLTELKKTSDAFIDKKIDGSIYSEIVIDGFKPKAIFCLSDGSKELNPNYRSGKILSEKFGLPLVDIDLTLYKKGKELDQIKKQLIINIKQLIYRIAEEQDDEYYNQFNYFWDEFLKLKTNDFEIEDILKLYYKNKKMIENNSIKRK